MNPDTIVERVLDWPVLGFVLALIVLFKLKDVLRARLESGAITVKWGDRTIELGELAPEVDQSVDHLQTQIDQLAARVEALAKRGGAGLPDEFPDAIETAGLSSFQMSRVREAMRDPRYYARSVEKLAAVAGVSVPAMKAALERMPDVIVDRAKIGDQMADVARLVE